MYICNILTYKNMIKDYCVEKRNRTTLVSVVLYAAGSVADCAKWLSENGEPLEYGEEYIVTARFF